MNNRQSAGKSISRHIHRLLRKS